MSKETYKPTRPEWVAVTMQAWIPMLLSQMRRLYPSEGADEVRVFFKADPPDTVRVVVRHEKSVPDGVIDYLDQEIGREIGEISKSHGWDSEIKVAWDGR